MGDRTVVVADGGGQTEVRSAGGLVEELRKPRLQWLLLYQLRVGLVLAVLALAVIWAPWSLYLVGFVPLILAVAKAADLEPDDAARLALPAVGLLALVAWLVVFDSVMDIFWPATLDVFGFAVPLRFTWHMHFALRLAPTVPLGVFVWNYPRLANRMEAEIEDPFWPPPIVPRKPESGPAFRGRRLQSAGAPDEPQVVERVIPRPVPVQSNERYFLPSVPEVAPERVQSFAKKARGKTVMAPSGGEVRLIDLLRFASMAPEVGTSFTGVWKGKGWDHAYWADIVDIWHLYGFTDKREERKKVRTLIGGQVAITRLVANLDNPGLWNLDSVEEGR